jgi:malonyl-CoA O-methyltransferase
MILEPQAAYALWAESYPPHPHNALMALEQQTLLSMLPEIDGRPALDAGCGTGRYLRLLRQRGARAAGIERCRVARGDIRCLPIRSMSVDVVVCGLVLGDVANLAGALAELARVLRLGGRLIYSVVHPIGERAGWSRTFAVAGRQNAIATWWHSTDAHRAAGAGVGLRIVDWKEPMLAAVPQHPALLVVSAERR